MTCGCSGNSESKGVAAVNPGENRAPENRAAANECWEPEHGANAQPAHTHSQQPHAERVPCVGKYEQHLFETPDEDICQSGPKNPYHVPGYEGHVPTLQSRSGKTFGQDTHEVLKSMPARSRGFYNQGSHICPEPMHQPYRIPGYTGFVPGLKSMVGGTYGSDTHKLLYSVDIQPNRQENLSPYKPTNQFGSGESKDQSGGTRLNGQSYNGGGGNGYPHDGAQSYQSYGQSPHSPNRNGGPFQAKGAQQGDTSATYERPKEHYYKPQYKYRIPDTYATRADITLVDPSVCKESKVVVSTRELDDTQVVRTQDSLEEKVEPSPYINKPIRHRPMVPGFDTFIDALRGARGQRFEFTAPSPSHKQLQQQMILQKGKVLDLPQAPRPEDGDHRSPTAGLGGSDDLPYGYSNYGKRQKYTNSALYDFTSNYRRRMSSEWAPAGISRPDPPAFDVPGEIYNQHMGLLPGYMGQVPGAMFRCGKTFTDDSRDARRALRGDRF